jgi:hypothetical protein
MAGELMLINPRRRHHKRRRRVIRAKSNPRRRRRRMSALQRRYFGGGRKRRVIRARSNPRRRRHRRHHYTVMRRNPSVSNPINFTTSTIIPAALGAVGGVATNYIFDNYAPVSLQTGILNPISRFGLAALLGFGVGALTDNRTGAMVAAGAMTVTAYDMIENYLSGQGLFQTAQGGYGQGGYSGYQGGQMGRFLRGNQMGRFLKGRGMGYMSPAPQISRFQH